MNFRGHHNPITRSATTCSDTIFFLHTYSWQNEDNHDAQWLRYTIEWVPQIKLEANEYSMEKWSEQLVIQRLEVRTPAQDITRSATTCSDTYSWQNEDNHNTQWLRYKSEGLRFWQYSLKTSHNFLFFLIEQKNIRNL